MSKETFKISRAGRHWFAAFLAVREQAAVYAFAETRPDAVRMLTVQLAMEVGWKQPTN